MDNTIAHKVCTKCKEDKPISEYSKSGKYYKGDCKKCVAKRVNEYRVKNYELVKQRKKEYWQRNRERLLPINNERSRIYAKLNPEKRKESANKWAIKNRKRTIENTKNRYNTDPEFNIAIKHRRRIGMALKRIGAGRKDRIIYLLGCDYKFFKSYIEDKFTDGMTWDSVLNGEIHLDHIKPCAKFNLLNFDEQKICFHYTNYQPLWAKDNMEKHDKYEPLWQK